MRELNNMLLIWQNYFLVCLICMHKLQLYFSLTKYLLCHIVIHTEGGIMKPSLMKIWIYTIIIVLT